MKNKDIKVGQLYKNSQHPESIYLGCGELRQKGRLFLVIIEDPLGCHLGAKVVSIEKAGYGFWDSFYKV